MGLFRFYWLPVVNEANPYWISVIDGNYFTEYAFFSWNLCVYDSDFRCLLLVNFDLRM